MTFAGRNLRVEAGRIGASIAVIAGLLAVVAPGAGAQQVPTLVISPSSGVPGDTIEAQGAAMPPGVVELHLDNADGLLLASTELVRTTTFTIRFVVPRVDAGPRTVFACSPQRGGGCLRRAAAILTVRPVPPPTTTTTRPPPSSSTSTSATTSPPIGIITSVPVPPPTGPGGLATPTTIGGDPVPSSTLVLGSLPPPPTNPSGLADPNAEPLPNLRLTAVEITQGIQDLQSRMPLVADRRTWIRLHVASGSANVDLGDLAGGAPPPVSSGPIPDVDGAILLQRGGAATVIYPENAPIEAVAQPDRTDPDAALNFLVPDAWDGEGDLSVTAVVWTLSPAAIDNEPDPEDNWLAGTRRFHAGDTQEVIVLPLHPGDNNPPGAAEMDLAEQLTIDSLLIYHPIAAPVVWRLQPSLGPGDEADSGDDDTTPNNWTFGDKASRTEPNIRMGEIHALWQLPGSIRFFGIFRSGLNTVFSGWSKSAYFSAWARPGIQTAGHELGHQRGLRHVRCADDDNDGKPDEPAGGAVDWTFPTQFPDCSLAPVDPAGFYGFTTYTEPLAIYSNDPASARAALPLMSYANITLWTDPYHYCRMLEGYDVPCDPLADLGLQPRTIPHGSVDCFPWQSQGAVLDLCLQGDLPPPAPNQQPDPATVEVLAPPVEEFALVSARFDPAARRAAVLPVVVVGSLSDDWRAAYDERVAAARRGEANSAASLAVFDAEGWLLAKIPAEMSGTGHGDGAATGPDASFAVSEIVPWPDGAARVDLLFDRVTVASRRASPGRPTVHVERVTPGRPVELSWTATDPDGDALTFDVDWSVDGEHWRPAATGLTATSAVLDDPSLPGGEQVLVRVRVSDGFHTTSGTTIAGNVPLADPTVSITGPDTVALHAPLVLLAGAVDPEDGVLEGDAVAWTSDRDGPLGAGRKLETRDLSEGRHSITATVTDSSGATATALHPLEVVNDGRRAPRLVGDVPAAERLLFARAGLDYDDGGTGDGGGSAIGVWVAVAAAVAAAAGLGAVGIRRRRQRAG